MSRGFLERELPALLVTLGVALLTAALVRAEGQPTISDDDFARVVIAQEFAIAPRLDPSGTSWLPLPFYLLGAPMLALGPTLEVARGVQLGLALITAGLLYAAARLLGARPLLASLGATLAVTLPYPARLALATVPEFPTAGLLVFAAAGAARLDALAQGRAEGGPDEVTVAARRSLALAVAVAAAAASASRYEAWPVALALGALLCLPRFGGPLPGLVAPAFIVAWLTHGLARHGDATFFVRRVAAYKLALGAPPPEPLAALTEGYPAALLAYGWAVWLPLLSVLAFALRTGRARGTTAPLCAPLALATLLVGTLVVADLRSGAPTHHPERALLSIWLGAALVTAALAERVLARAEGSARAARLGFFALAALSLVAGLRLERAPAPLVDRREEERLGRELRTRAGGPPVVLATPDYGYFAVQAAAGPGVRTLVAARNDPRAPEVLPLHDAALALAKRSGASRLVGPREWADEPALERAVVARGERLALFTLRPTGP